MNEVLAKALGRCGTAGQVFYLDNHSLGPAGLSVLEPELRACQGVERLQLGANHLGPEGARVVAGLVPHLPRLKHLWLSENALGDEGARVMAAMLRKPSSSVTHLNLSRNDLTDKGTQVLAAALLRNGCLTQLYLSGNSIGTEGLRALCGAIESNVTLQWMTLGGNPCAEDKALMDVLYAALKRNKELAPLFPARRSNCRAALVVLLGVRRFRGVWKRLDRNVVKVYIAQVGWYEMRHNEAWDQ